MARLGLTPGRLGALLRHAPWLDSYLQRQRRRRLARGAGYPDWTEAARSAPLTPRKSTGDTRGTRILLATSLGGHLPAMQMETTLAAALAHRGVAVEALLCDGALPACQLCEPREFPSPARFIEQGPARDLCPSCYVPGQRPYLALGVPVHTYSSCLSNVDRARSAALAATTPEADLDSVELEGIPIGQHARAGALRFLARGTFDGHSTTTAIRRRYLEAAALTALATQRLLGRQTFDVAVFHHGIYVPQGVIGDVARRMGIRVVNWNPAYRRGCFIFSHGDSYHHTMLAEPASSWENLPWTHDREAQLTAYLRSRWHGTDDWISFQDRPYTDPTAIRRHLGIDLARPIIGCLTNVMWDAQLHYPANAFPDMRSWLIATISYFRERPALQLVIRVHPAEVHGSVPSRQPIIDELRAAFPEWPGNVYLVPPDDRMSTYALCELCDAVLIYGTKTGIELAAMGIPVVVAGEGWVRNKGLSLDAESPDSYRDLLDRLPLGHRMDPATVVRARRYAHHFFFRRMIPVTSLVPHDGWPPYTFSGRLADLAPGADPGLDVILRGILEGTPFVHDA